MAMNHSDASAANADTTKQCSGNLVEKYLLGELTAKEREAFEAHYFDCQECAEDLQAGAMFVDNAREVWRTEAPPKLAAVPAARRNWWAWLQPVYAAAAIVILLATVFVQNVVTIPRMRQEISSNQPQVLKSFTLRDGGARSGGIDTIETDPGRPFSLYVDIGASQSGVTYASYTCQLQTESGAVKFITDVPPEKAADSVELLVPGSTLAPGNYALVLYGHATFQGPEAAGVELARIPFQFRAGK